jgi:hypothetical protein
MRIESKKNIFVIIFVLSILCFAIGQLIINSELTPMGLELEALNKEKNYLIEENRSMEEEIAKTNSIIVIKKLAGKTLKLSNKNPKAIIYIEDTNIIAEI